MNWAVSAGIRFPLCEQAVAPTGRMQYCTKLLGPLRSLVLAQAMKALPALSTVTDGGPLENGVPTLTGFPAASAPVANTSATTTVSAPSSTVRRTAIAP